MEHRLKSVPPASHLEQALKSVPPVANNLSAGGTGFSLWALRWLVFAAVAGLLAFQLFIPPIVGLSDQGDFGRMIGRFGYGPADKSTPLSAGFVQPKYVRDPSTRIPILEQAGPEYLFIGTAIGLSKLLSKGVLDIRVVGFVHAVAFLAAFGWLLRVTGPITWIVASIALTDVGYVAYWNSFYTEPATCIFFLLLAAESIGMCNGRQISASQLARWSLWASMLVWAKSSNYPLAAVLAPFALYLGWRAKNTRVAGTVGAVAIAAFAILTMQTRPQPMQRATTYNSIFMAILPESPTPAADLQELGLDPNLASFSGTGAWTPRTAFPALYDRVLVRNVTGATVARFYLQHPTRIWRRAKALLPVAFSLRPEWCGNFEQSAGRPEGAKTTSVTLWSQFHEQLLAPAGRVILIALAALPLIAFRRGLPFKFFGALAACTLIAFLTAACGDAWDNAKHMFLFNLLLDACLILGVSKLRQSFRQRKSESA
jgi:hypothetical protein